MALASLSSTSPYPLSSYAVHGSRELKIMERILSDWSKQALALAGKQRVGEDRETLENYSRFAKDMGDIVALMAKPKGTSLWKRFTVVVTKDHNRKVQAIEICALKEIAPFPEAPWINLKAHTCVTHLITAPWNMNVRDRDPRHTKVSGAAKAALAKCSQLGYRFNQGALYVESTEPAEPFYERLGFWKDEENRNFYNETVPMFLSPRQAQLTFGTQHKLAVRPQAKDRVFLVYMIRDPRDLEELKNTLYGWSRRAMVMSKFARESRRTQLEHYSQFARSVLNILTFMARPHLQNSHPWHLYTVIVAKNPDGRVQAIAICALQKTPWYVGAPHESPDYTCVTHLISMPKESLQQWRPAAIAVLSKCSQLSSHINGGSLYLQADETDERFLDSIGFKIEDEETRNYVTRTVPMFLSAEQAKFLPVRN